MHAAFFTLCLLLFGSANALAELEVQILLTDHSFELTDEGFAQESGKPKNWNEPHAQAGARDALRSVRIDADRFREISVRNGTASTPGALARKAQLFRREFLAQAKKFNATTTYQDGHKILKIRDGAGFWAALLTHKDSDVREGATAFLGSGQRREENWLQSLLSGLLQKEDTARIVEADRLKLADWEAISRISQREGLSITRRGKYGVIGSGFPFLATSETLNTGRAYAHMPQHESLEQVLDHFAQRGLNIQYDPRGIAWASAYYVNGEERIGFVSLDSTMNPLVHEGTHGRFEKFKKQLAAWAMARKLVLPYEITGPGGGYFELLNEVNSYRAGNAFDYHVDDAKILESLKRHYGVQAGEEATQMFAELWTPERLAGKSVPRLILELTRALNGMNEAELLAYGESALKKSDIGAQVNFLRLIEMRYPDPAKPPEALGKIFDSILTSTQAGVREAYMSQALDRSREMREGLAEQKRSEIFHRNLKAWLARVTPRGNYFVPESLQGPMGLLLRTAQEFQIEEFAPLQAKIRHEMGILIPDNMAEVFASLKTIPLKTWDEKAAFVITAANKEAREIGFEKLWSMYMSEPSLDLYNVILHHYADEVDSVRLKSLIQIASGDSVKHKLSPAHALQLLENLVKRSPKVREVFESAAIDGYLADTMVGGKITPARMALADFIQASGPPEKHPELLRRILRAVSDLRISTDERRSPLLFFRLENLTTENIEWKKRIAHEATRTLGKESRHWPLIRQVPLFYQRIGIDALPGLQWGRDGVTVLDAKAREESRAVFQALPAKKRAEVLSAASELGKLLKSDSLAMKSDAATALMGYPFFSVLLEDEILDLIKSEDGFLRYVGIRMYSITRDGFLPKIDAHFAANPPNYRQRHMLRMRIPPSEEEAWCPGKYSRFVRDER